MNTVRKISQILILTLLIATLFSCSDGCVEADQFDAESSIVESNPVVDGVTGTYDDVNGGQIAEWHDTGFRSNGDKFVILVSGAWSPWGNDGGATAPIATMPTCDFCAKRAAGGGVSASANCLCYPGKTPQAEKDPSGQDATTASNCRNNIDAQNNPNLCTCTNDTRQGRYGDQNVYFFPLNIYDKNEISKIADKISTCRYDRGMGLYLGLFGYNGSIVPKRVYHLFATEEVCNITRRSDNKCIDDSGNDRTLYMYRSADNKIFLKDDGVENKGVDTNSAGDVYHGANEKIKLIINDRYYSDNYGRYNVSFLRGVGVDGEKGILEFSVRLVEDTLLGAVNRNGVREGGVIEYMYKAITQDSSFMIALQILLSLYISFFGLATLFGVAELGRKELMSRLVKIGLVLLFTRFESWQIYNEIVVRFFKDGMDYVISIMMDLSDSQIEASSMVKTAQFDRATDYSNATRFSYVDVMITKLMSEGVAKKVFGLFFGVLFGVIYIPAIYFLIAFFIYVMLIVAMIYLVNVVKIIFALALGPIFIVFSLFSHTENMFKNWVSFLGARSLEIIFVFTILYNFLVLIDRSFTDLLSYRACVHSYPIIPGLIYIKILKSELSYGSRSLFEWITSFITIGGLIFITKLIVEKVGDISGHLISIGGVANKDGNDTGRGSGGFGSASNMAGEAKGLFSAAASSAGSKLGTAGTYGLRAATSLARSSGLAEKWNNSVGNIPGPRSIARNMMINSAIKNARAEAAAKGLTGKAADEHVRSSAVGALQSRMYHDPKKMQLAGMDMNNITKQLEAQLVKKPLKNFIKDEAKRMKDGAAAGVPVGKDFRKELRERARNWAEGNLVGGKAAVDAYLGQGKDSAGGLSKIKSQQGDKSIKSLIRSATEMTSSEVAEKFSGNKEKQQEYQKFLDEKQYREHKLDERSKAGSYWQEAGRSILKGVRKIGRDTEHNVDMTRENVARKLDYQDTKGDGLLDSLGINTSKIGVASRVNVLDKLSQRIDSKGELTGFERDADAAQRDSLLERLRNDRLLPEQKREFFTNQLKALARKSVEVDARVAQGKVDAVRNNRASQLSAIEKSRVSQLEKVERDKRESLKQIKDSDTNASANRVRIENEAYTERARIAMESEEKAKKVKEESDKLLERERKEQREKLLKSVVDRECSELEKAEQLRRLQDLNLKDMSIDTRYMVARLEAQAAEAASQKAEKALAEFMEASERSNKAIAALAAAKDAAVTAADKVAAEQREKDLKAIADDASKSLAAAAANMSDLKAPQGTVVCGASVTQALLDGDINKALIQGSNVGLKAGNVLLGQEAKGVADAKLAEEAAIKSSKQHHADLMVKMAKMEKGMLELKIKVIEAKGTNLSDSEKRELDSLSREIVEATRNLDQSERDRRSLSVS